MILNINQSKINQGIIGVTAYDETTPQFDFRVFIDCVRSHQYRYRIGDGEEDWFSLQSGSGEYKITILNQINATQYKPIKALTINPRFKDEDIYALQSNTYMQWRGDMKCIQFAKEITWSCYNDMMKLQVLWDWITKNIDYDNPLAETIKYGYTPDIEQIFTNKKAICFGYSALFGSMLRSVGIKAKMVHGYVANLVSGFHAWNEVYIDGQWQTMDVTMDRSFVKAGKKAILFKSKDFVKEVVNYY